MLEILKKICADLESVGFKNAKVITREVTKKKLAAPVKKGAAVKSVAKTTKITEIRADISDKSMGDIFAAAQCCFECHNLECSHIHAKDGVLYIRDICKAKAKPSTADKPAKNAAKK